MATTPSPELGTRVNIESPETEIFIAVDVFFIVATLIGNGAIVFAVHKNKQLRSSPSILFIISVAVSHILVGIVVLPMFVMSHFPDNVASSTSCKAFAYLTKLASTASLGAIIPLTFDAFLRNKGYYDRKSLTWFSAVAQVASTWCFAAVYAVLHCVIVDFQVVTGEDEQGRWHAKLCHIPKDLEHVHKIIVLVDVGLLFLLPVIFLISLTVTILCWHWRRSVPVELLDPAERKRRKLSTRTSTIFLIVFTLFNIGNYMITVYIFWGPGAFRNIHLWTSICTLLGYSMCWVNVVMILVFNATFRRTVFGKENQSSPSTTEMDSKRTGHDAPSDLNENKQEINKETNI